MAEGRRVYEGVEFVTVTEFVEDILGARVADDGEPLPLRASLRSRRRR